MRTREFLSTWEGALGENRFHRKALAALAAANLLLVAALLTKDTTVVLVPPTLDKRVEVSDSRSSPDVYSMWGLHVATLLGNVTPANAEFLSASLAPMLGPEIYRGVLDAIAQQVTLIKEEQLTLAFRPSEVRYDDAGHRVYVMGELVTRGARNVEEREIRTYELAFSTLNHAVRLDELLVHKGPPPASASGH